MFIILMELIINHHLHTEFVTINNYNVRFFYNIVRCEIDCANSDSDVSTVGKDFIGSHTISR